MIGAPKPMQYETVLAFWVALAKLEAPPPRKGTSIKRTVGVVRYDELAILTMRYVGECTYRTVQARMGITTAFVTKRSLTGLYAVCCPENRRRCNQMLPCLDADEQLTYVISYLRELITSWRPPNNIVDNPIRLGDNDLSSDERECA